MLWTEDDTLAVSISNRIRQVICKRNPNGYSQLMDPAAVHVKNLMVKVDRFELRLTWQGHVSVITRESTVSSAEVFRCKPLQAKSRPDYRWSEKVVREELNHALDTEMVLDDLSLL